VCIAVKSVAGEAAGRDLRQFLAGLQINLRQPGHPGVLSQWTDGHHSVSHYSQEHGRNTSPAAQCGGRMRLNAWILQEDRGRRGEPEGGVALDRTARI